MQKRYKIINHGVTIANHSALYRNNNVSKENFYSKFGYYFDQWNMEKVNKLTWEYVKPCINSKKYHVFYCPEIDAYNITDFNNVEEYHTAYEINYAKNDTINKD